MKGSLITLFLLAATIGRVDRPQETDSSQTEYLALTHDLKSNSIPDQVFEMKKLTAISITGMNCDQSEPNCWKIRSIPSQIVKLKNLEVLNFYYNAISTIPPELVQLKKLRSLIIADNSKLQNIDNIVLLKNLECLSLTNCGLTKLPLDIGKLSKLQILELCENQIPKAEQDRIKKALPHCKYISFKERLLMHEVPKEEINKLLDIKQN